MTEQDTANLFTFAMAVFGMLICLVVGYFLGYKDAKRLYK